MIRGVEVPERISRRPARSTLFTVIVIVVAVLLAATLVAHLLADDSPPASGAPLSDSSVMTHPREGAMYHQPYTSTR